MTDTTRIDEQKLAESLAASLTEATPGLGERIANDPEAYLDLVAVAAKAERKTGELLRSAVTAARSAGQSWEAIGAKLGISRQAAQKRYGEGAGGGEEAARQGGEGEVRVISGLTAFNEMRVLERVGRYGWHSIGYGALHHVVRKSDRQWSHVRIVGAPETMAKLLAEGWEMVGSMWFPWAYLKRELSEPALVEEDGLGSSLRRV